MLMQRHLTRPSLADVMVREGILPRRTVDQVVARLGGSTTALGQTLVEEGTISEAQLAQALLTGDGAVDATARAKELPCPQPATV